MLLNSDNFKGFPRRYRSNFFNSLLGYKPVLLVGSKSKGGKENLAVFSSAVHFGADPPLVGLVSRPHSVERHTLENIKETGSYTLSHVSPHFFKAAHQSSAKYPANISEFAAVGLSPAYQTNFQAPYVNESEVKIGLSLKEIVPIKLNNTLLIIGQIKWVELAKQNILQDGSLDFDALETISVTGLDTYHQATKLEKLPYARPESSK